MMTILSLVSVVEMPMVEVSAVAAADVARATSEASAKMTPEKFLIFPFLFTRLSVASLFPLSTP